MVSIILLRNNYQGENLIKITRESFDRKKNIILISRVKYEIKSVKINAPFSVNLAGVSLKCIGIFLVKVFIHFLYFFKE